MSDPPPAWSTQAAQDQSDFRIKGPTMAALRAAAARRDISGAQLIQLAIERSAAAVGVQTAGQGAE